MAHSLTRTGPAPFGLSHSSVSQAKPLVPCAVTFRLTENLDPEERLEEAALWKAMHDEYGDLIKPMTGDALATFGRSRKAEGENRLDYWSDPAFLNHCRRSFVTVEFDGVAAEVRKLHERGLGAFVKSARSKHWIERIPVGTDWERAIGEMAYSFIDGGPELMVQELCEIRSEHRFFCIAREIVTFSESRPELTPLDFPRRQSTLSKELVPMGRLAQTIAAEMRQPTATIDVAYINGELGVVEFNPLRLGQVGLFACDVRALAAASRNMLPASAD